MTLFNDVETAPEPGEPDLPPLRGTASQIPWATAERKAQILALRRHFRDWQELIRRHEDAGRDDAAERERAGLRHAIDELAYLERQDTCRFWLDSRKSSVLELLARDYKPGASSWQSQAPGEAPGPREARGGG